MDVRPCFPTPGSGVSCMLLWIWPTAFLSAQLLQTLVQNGAIRSLSRWTPRRFAPIIPGIPSSLNSVTHIFAHVSLCERFVALQLFFSPSWAPRWLCAKRFFLLEALQSHVHPFLLVSTLRSLAVHCLRLFPNGAWSSRVTPRFRLGGPPAFPWAPQFCFGSGPSATFPARVSGSSLRFQSVSFQCSLGGRPL